MNKKNAHTFQTVLTRIIEQPHTMKTIMQRKRVCSLSLVATQTAGRFRMSHCSLTALFMLMSSPLRSMLCFIPCFIPYFIPAGTDLYIKSLRSNLNMQPHVQWLIYAIYACVYTTHKRGSMAKQGWHEEEVMKTGILWCNIVSPPSTAIFKLP